MLAQSVHYYFTSMCSLKNPHEVLLFCFSLFKASNSAEVSNEAIILAEDTSPRGQNSKT